MDAHVGRRRPQDRLAATRLTIAALGGGLSLREASRSAAASPSSAGSNGVAPRRTDSGIWDSNDARTESMIFSSASYTPTPVQQYAFFGHVYVLFFVQFRALLHTETRPPNARAIVP